MQTSAPPRISFVVCSIDAAKFAALAANLRAVMGALPHELIGIHDARSLCEGYNRGFRQTTAPVIVFCHDDIEILTPDFAARLLRHLEHADVVGPAGCSYLFDGSWAHAGAPHLHGQVGQYDPTREMPYFAAVFDFARSAPAGETLTLGMQALDGLFIAVRRPVMEVVRFDEETFDGFHGYDVDFTYSAFLAGFTLGAFTDIGILHYSLGNFGAAYRHYRQRFDDKHKATLLPAIPPGEKFTAVLYPDKTTLAQSFELDTRKQLAARIDACFAERAAVPEPATLPAPAAGGWFRQVLRVLIKRS